MCSLATVLGPGVESSTPLHGAAAHDFCTTQRLCNTAAEVDQAIASPRPVSESGHRNVPGQYLCASSTRRGLKATQLEDRPHESVIRSHMTQPDTA
jgi:hypothetical protein